MFEEFTYNGLNWKSTGYFGCPDRVSEYVCPADANKRDIELWINVFQKAKNGDFTAVPELIDVLICTSPTPMSASCCALIGDAGNFQSFNRVLDEIKKPHSLNVIIYFCEILWQRGKLSDVLVLLEIYQSNFRKPAANIITLWISDLLGQHSLRYSELFEFGGIKEYCCAVESQVAKLAIQMLNQDELIFAGEKFGIKKLALIIKERLKKPYFRASVRHRFEAQVGIDCSSFYSSEIFQPLAAAAIVEDFLEKGEADKYQHGERYFFGHCI